MRTKLQSSQRRVPCASMAITLLAVITLFSCSQKTLAQQWSTSSDGNDISNTNSRNVGIGTTSPASKLVVKGADATSTNSALNVTDSSNNSILSVRNDGRVSVGTTNPFSFFHVKALGNWLTHSTPKGIVTQSGSLFDFSYSDSSSTHANLTSSEAFIDLVANPSAGKSINGISSLPLVPASNSAALSNLTLRGIDSWPSFQGTGSIQQLQGIRLVSENANTGSMFNLQGVVSQVQNLNAAGVVTNVIGVDTWMPNNTGTVTNYFGARINSLSNSGTITNTYGVYVGDITSAGTHTNKPFSFYASDPNTDSYFAGNVGIGTSTPGTAFDINRTATNGEGAYLYLSDTANIGHGITTLHPSTVFGTFVKGHGTAGGLIVRGLEDTGAQPALKLDGLLGNNNPTDSAPAVLVRGFKKDTGTSFTTLGNLETVFQVSNSTTSPLMTVLGSGNTGLGLLTPAFRLDVSGQINGSNGLCINGDCKTAWSQVGSQWLGSTDIHYSTGKVGVGISSPLYSLDVNGGVNGFRAKAATTSSSDTIASFENASGVQAVVRGNGNVGVGTTSPQRSVTLYRTSGPVLQLVDNLSGTTANDGLLLVQDGLNSYLENSEAGSVNFRTSATTRMTINASGDVGIGITTPAARLDVNGNTKINGNIDLTGTGNITAAGTIEGGNIKAKYQDVAEWVESSQELSAGTLVVLDHTKSNQVIASTQAYDTRVAGVISERPGIALGEAGDNRVLVATTGRVRLTVDASRGPIQIGDLLVTSDISGVAMKSEAINVGGVQLHRPGTLVGKALEPLAKGQGKILVLLSLQ